MFKFLQHIQLRAAFHIALLTLASACTQFSDTCPTVQVPLGLEKIESNRGNFEMLYANGTCSRKDKNFQANINAGILASQSGQAFVRIAALNPEGKIVSMKAKLFDLSQGNNIINIDTSVNTVDIPFPASSIRFIIALVP